MFTLWSEGRAPLFQAGDMPPAQPVSERGLAPRVRKACLRRWVHTPLEAMAGSTRSSAPQTIPIQGSGARNTFHPRPYSAARRAHHTVTITYSAAVKASLVRHQEQEGLPQADDGDHAPRAMVVSGCGRSDRRRSRPRANKSKGKGMGPDTGDLLHLHRALRSTILLKP